MNSIILQTLGWEKGWELLTEIAGNTYQFTQSSSDPIKAVVSANTATSMAIDFYALAKIGDLGPEALGFSLPEGKTILDPDPVALIKGAPNKVAAERFIEFVLGSEAQKLLVLPKGQPDGPKLASLGRMAVNTATYTATEGRRVHNVNPFNEKPAFKLDNDKAAKLKDVLNDLVGSMHVDTHKELKTAWDRVVKGGVKPADVTALSAMPVTEAEALALTDKWQDEVFRNKTINGWVEFAKQKYAKVAAAH
jgi:hypothetical protein